VTQAPSANAPETESPLVEAEAKGEVAPPTEESAFRPTLEETPSPGDPRNVSAVVDAARKSLAEELMPVLGNKRDTEKLFSKKWSESIANLPNAPLPSSSSQDIAAGSVLPEECIEIVSNPGRYLSGVLRGKSPMFSDDQSLASVGILELSSVGLEGELSSQLLKRSDELPPTESDLAVFAVALFAINENGPKMRNGREWERLANAENPIYRFLALRAARQGDWAGSPHSARYSFAQRFENETDITLINERIRLLGTIPLPDVRADLEVLQTEFAGTETEQIANEALRTLDLLAQAQR